jgi:hypothetical protein
MARNITAQELKLLEEYFKNTDLQKALEYHNEEELLQMEMNRD